MITRNFSFIEGYIDDIKSHIINIMGPEYPVTECAPAELKVVLDYEDIGSCIAQMVLWAPSPAQTAIYGNQSDGFSVLCNILNHRFGYNVTNISLTLDLDNKINSFDIYLFRLFEFLGQNGKKRLVRVMQDPRWDFYEIGEPFPFEQTEKYKERIKKKRLTNDMILDYAEAMGYDVRNPEFWKSDNATYLEWSWIPVTKQDKP